jgi:hypothetical protein
MLDPQLVALFCEVVKTLGVGAELKEAVHWGPVLESYIMSSGYLVSSPFHCFLSTKK